MTMVKLSLQTHLAACGLGLQGGSKQDRAVLAAEHQAGLRPTLALLTHKKYTNRQKIRGLTDSLHRANEVSLLVVLSCRACTVVLSIPA